LVLMSVSCCKTKGYIRFGPAEDYKAPRRRLL